MAKRKKPSRKEIVRFLISLLIVLILALVGYCAYEFFLKDFFASPEGSSYSSSGPTSSSLSSSSGPTSSSLSSGSLSEEGYDPISFHFLDLRIRYTGDCTYIKAGENDILIDAGARQGSAAVIDEYLSQHVEDGRLEYVIATHAHQDHIAGFVGNADDSLTGGRTGILYQYKVDTLIDFPLTDATTTIYRNYQAAVEHAVQGGATHYTALQCVNEEEGASKVYDLGKGLEMEVLYNYFYDHDKTDFRKDFPEIGGSFSEENDFSVSLLFRQGEKAMLFTGDSEAWSEHSLVTHNELPANVVLYKGGHHGSYTANGEELLQATSPDAIVFECTAGNNEYASSPEHSFPAQETIDRIAPYTDRVYVTQQGDWEEPSRFEPLNGTVVASYDERGDETFSFTGSDLPLKESEWFLENRTMPEAWR